MKQVELAVEFGIAQTSVSRYLRGEQSGGYLATRSPGFQWPLRVCAGCGEKYQPTSANQRWCQPFCTSYDKCAQCDDPEPEFYLRAGAPLQPCKSCRRVAGVVRWHSMLPDQKDQKALLRWALALQQKFKMSVEDYWRMYDEQDGRCKICCRSLEEIGSERFKHFSVDHDRRCCPGDNSCGNCVRGLLCTKCNGVFGWYEQFALAILAYAAAREVVV